MTVRNLIALALQSEQIPEPGDKPGPTIKMREDLVRGLSESEIEKRGPFADITLIWEVSNDGYAGIEIRLWDIGSDDGERKIYDLSFSVGNSDNVGPITMLTQLQLCVEQFVEMGLDTKFGDIIGMHELEGLKR